MDTKNIETQAPIISLTDAAVKEVKRLINVQGIEEGGQSSRSAREFC